MQTTTQPTDDARWEALFASEQGQNALNKLADDALADIRAGRASPMIFTDDDELGVVNTARFTDQPTSGGGNYTEERDQLVGHLTVDEIVAEIKRKRRNVRKAKRKTIQNFSPPEMVTDNED